MLKWGSIPFFRFVMALLSGILLYIYMPYSINYLPFFSIAVILYVLLFLISSNKRRFHQLKPYLGIAALLTLFFLGALLSQVRDEKNDPSHLIHLKEKPEYYLATITETSEEREKTYRTEICIDKIKTSKGWIKAKGRILLYSQKQNFNPLVYGDQVLIKGSPKLTEAPANPFEFDYQSYLRFQQIHHTHFIKSNELTLSGNNPPSLLIAASLLIRDKASAILREFIQGDNEFKIASALILGVRSTLDNELKNAYSSTGTMHVLAVSGLHVGIVLGMLVLLLNFLKKIPTGRILLPVVLIILLWIYAFVTGFSASVLRAVVMFSLVIVARSLERNTNIYNTLALSAFILLCIDPFFIMNAGFQLSFLAVLGIVFFQPKIYGLISCKNKWVDKLWILTSVSIAAQISTFPITLYYFHQFPANFIFSNLIAIPLSFGILYAGMFLLMLSWIPGINHLLGWITEKGIWLMNEAIFIIEDIPYSVITGIDLDLPEISCLYLMILFISAFLLNKKIRYLKASLLILLCFETIQTLEVFHQKNQKKFIVFSIQGHTALGFIKGNRIDILADPSLIENRNKQEFHIYPYLIQHGIKEINFKNIRENIKEPTMHITDSISLVCFQGKSFLIQKNTFKKLSNGIRPDFEILSDNRKKALAFEATL